MVWPRHFLHVVGTYVGHLPLSEDRCFGVSTWRWWRPPQWWRVLLLLLHPEAIRIFWGDVDCVSENMKDQASSWNLQDVYFQYRCTSWPFLATNFVLSRQCILQFCSFTVVCIVYVSQLVGSYLTSIRIDPDWCSDISKPGFSRYADPDSPGQLFGC